MTTTNRKDRFWIIGGAVLAVVLAAASWFFLISPKMDDSASVRDQTAQAAQQNDVLQAKVNKLRADSASMPSLLAELDRLHAQLPTGADLDDLTRQITGQAAAAKVTVSSIVFGIPAAVQKSAPAAPSTADQAAATGSAEAAPAPTTAATTAATSTAAAPAAKPAANLYAIPVTIVADGPLANQQTLLSAIQTQGPRGALVSSVHFSPAAQTATPTGGEPAARERTSAAGGATRTGASTTGVAPSTGGSTTGGAQRVPLSTPVTMTVQMTVFVAPQSPDDEAALRKQLGG